MSITITLTQIQEGLDGVEIFGSLAFAGAYPAGGDIIDWTTVSGISTPNGRTFVPSGQPVYGAVQGSTGDDYGPILGTALNNGKIKINTASNTELAGNYPARITGDANILFSYAFPKLT